MPSDCALNVEARGALIGSISVAQYLGASIKYGHEVSDPMPVPPRPSDDERV